MELKKDYDEKIENFSIMYQGYFKNNKFEGEGKACWKDGDKYIGQWKQGQRHGYGEFFKKNGAIYKGLFNENKLDGIVIFFTKSKNCEQGEWLNDMRHGKQIIYYSNQIIG